MNNIELSTVYLPLLDEVYKEAVKTSVLDGDEATVRKGQNGEIKVAKLDMDGLGDFSRNSGYTEGSTSLTWETIRYDKERSQKLKVDRLDNEESLGVMVAKLSSEFLRTKVAPETDAARIAKIAGTTGITRKAETITTGAEMYSALRTGTNAMDEDEVSRENRILFITPTGKALVDDLDTYKSKSVMERFSQVIEVPQSRMMTAITLNTGEENYGYKRADAVYVKTTDESLVTGKTYYTRSGSEGAYVYTAVAEPAAANLSSYYELKSEAGKDINFMIVEKSAAVTAMEQFIKYFSPDEDQNGDSHIFPYRNYNLYGHVYENKLSGVYVSYDNA